MIDSLISFFKEEESIPIWTVDDSQTNAGKDSIFEELESDTDTECEDIDNSNFKKIDFWWGYFYKLVAYIFMYLNSINDHEIKN